MINLIVCMVLTMLLWGAWPLVSASSGVKGAYAALVIQVAALLPILVDVVYRGQELPSASATVRLSLAGFMLGLGLILFNAVNESSLQRSVSIPIMDTGLLVVTAAGAIYFFGDSISLNKVFFLALMVIGIIGLGRS